MRRTIQSSILLFSIVFLNALGGWDDAWGAEPTVRITSPKDGAQIEQVKDLVLVTGKVSTEGLPVPKIDLVLVIDVSSSTARYSGVNFGPSDQPPASSPGSGTQKQVGVFSGGLGGATPVIMDLKNSILVAEVAAARRLLLRLDSKMTRVGIVTFGDEADLAQPLTHDFKQVHRSLDNVLAMGPHGGTHMVGGIRMGIRELSGLARSQPRKNAVKVQVLLTDGFPTLPIGGGKANAPEDTELAINAARIAGKSGIKIHVFALGKEALSYPAAAVGVSKISGGVFTPVVRPADIMTVMRKMSVIGVDTVQVFNKTTGKRALHLRLEADGFFSTALSMAAGLNRIQVVARASGGSIGKESISVFYRPAVRRSLDVEVFVEKEKSLQLEVEKVQDKGNGLHE